MAKAKGWKSSLKVCTHQSENKQTNKNLSLVAQLSLCDQIAEVEYFELARRRDGSKNRLPCLSICGRPVALQVCHGFVCNFIAPQIKFAFGVYTAWELVIILNPMIWGTSKKDVLQFHEFHMAVAQAYLTKRDADDEHVQEEGAHVLQEGHKCHVTPVPLSQSVQLLQQRMEMVNLRNPMHCRGKGYSRKSCVRCATCNVFLCLQTERNCFAAFHTDKKVWRNLPTRIHIGENTYYITICLSVRNVKVFWSWNDLVRKIHKGENQYQCQECAMEMFCPKEMFCPM